MRHEPQDGFLIVQSDVAKDILIPRYYDPRIARSLNLLESDHRLISIQEMVEAKWLKHEQGDYVPKMHYGTGPIPYVRTSDIADWEIKASPKHGVSCEVYEEYRHDQDVRAEDILFVHEGTYLIGTVAVVTSLDGPMLYQHHLAKFRVLENAPFGTYFFAAALESPLVQRQIRSKQFSADIIDSVVGRVGEVVIPVPKDNRRRSAINERIRDAIIRRAEVREQLAYVFREYDRFLRGTSELKLDAIVAWKPTTVHQGQMQFLGSRSGFSSFLLPNPGVKENILLPKYYDPTTAELAKSYDSKCVLLPLSELVNAGVVHLATGDEVGKMCYGTGEIPFVRTSDFGNWELKRDTKQGVSEEVYQQWSSKQSIQAQDILLVRDGTYLVGTSVLVCESDLPLLYCGGLINLRCMSDHLTPASLFTMLNLPFVRRQMRNKQFTRDVIDTLGHRLGEIRLPIPRDTKTQEIVSSTVLSLVEERNKLRRLLGEITSTMYD